MRRAVARGRVFPQSYSTDRRYGRLSLKACAIFPLMWANADDQGRLPGDPEEIKYACCPNIDHIAKADIPGLLEELAKTGLIKLYNTSKTKAIQILDWWDVHRPQWAWPSQYPPPEGWQDHLRYKKGAKEVATQNWPVSGETQNGTQVSENNGSGETAQRPLLTTHMKEETERGKRKEEGGNSPETQNGTQVRNHPSPSPTGDLIKNSSEIFSELTNCFRYRWGRVPAEDPYSVIPREPDPKESAQLRDLAEELSAAGGLPRGFVKRAFDEAVEYEKKHISYVGGVLFAWMGIERDPPGEKRRPGRRKRAGVPLNEKTGAH